MNAQHAENQRLAEEAAEWVLRRTEDRSPECSAEFIRWLKDSPHHIDEYLLAATTYAALREGNASELLDIAALLGHEPSNVISLDRVTISPKETIADPSQHSAPAHRNWWLHPTWRGFRLAASLAAVAFGLWAAWFYVSGLHTYTTGTGEQRMVRLEDGSLVHMNTRSRIKVAFSDSARELKLLEGEAFFTAAKDTARPFRVITHGAAVQALGTQFNVYEHDGETKVAVVDGEVRVTARATDTPASQLGAGDQVDVRGSGEIVKRTIPDIGTALAWRERQLVFRAVPLADVAEEFNRYNDYRIRIEGAKLQQRLIWGVFPVDEPQALVKFLAQDGAVKLTKSRNGLVAALAR